MPFNRKDHHNFGEIRPRFRLISPLSPPEILERLDTFCKNDKTVAGRKIHDQFYLDIPMKYRHFWSPELRILVEKDQNDTTKTLIRVTVGPQAFVWITFAISYAVLGLISFFGGMFGLVQWSQGNDSNWIWCLPVTSFIILAVWMIAKSGQKASRDDTLHLVSSLYHAIGIGNAERIAS
jgi:hypothetical protein